MLEPVGIKEIAERLGVPRQTAAVWRYRKVLPKEAGKVSDVPYWDWAVIETWSRETGHPRPSSR